MSVHVTSWVLRHSTERLGNRLVLLVLADKAEEDGTNAWPSVATIAREARMTERQAQRCLRSLQANGSIVKQDGRHRKGAQRHGTYIYDVVMKDDILSPSEDERVTSTTVKGDILDGESVQRVAQMSPEPSLEQPSELQPSFNPLTGQKVAGQDLLWNALSSAVGGSTKIEGSRMRRALDSIRIDLWDWVQERGPQAAAYATSDPEMYERWAAESIAQVARALRENAPTLTWGPEGVARNFRRGIAMTEGHVDADAIDAMVAKIRAERAA